MDGSYRINYGNGQVSEVMSRAEAKRQIEHEEASAFIQVREWVQNEESFVLDWRRVKISKE